jgi:hypothetical protein
MNTLLAILLLAVAYQLGKYMGFRDAERIICKGQRPND